MLEVEFERALTTLFLPSFHPPDGSFTTVTLLRCERTKPFASVFLASTLLSLAYRGMPSHSKGTTYSD